MRTISAGLTSAIQNSAGIKPSLRATIYKSRQFFTASDIEDTYEASFAQSSGIQESPLSQDMTYCDEMDKLITVYAESNVIKLQAEGIAEFTPTLGGNPIATTTHCRPSVITTSGSAGYLYFYSSGSACFAEFDTEDAVAGTATCTSGSGSMEPMGYCALHAVDIDDVMALSIDDGGVKVTHIYYDGGWLTNEWDRRFMYPTHVYNDADDILLNFSGAVKRDLGGGDYERIVYLSMPNGSVKGVTLNADGSWSDPFEAVPADLSRFLVSNATVAPNGNVHLIGQFKRVDVVPRDEDDVYSDVEEPTYFNSTVVSCLDLWSREGKVFSLDRFSLFAAEDTAAGGSESAFRYQLAVKDGATDTIFYSDANRILEDDAIVSTSGSGAEYLDIPSGDIASLSGAPNTGWTLKIKNGDESYSNEELVAQGNKIDIEFGTSGSYAYLDECIITNVDSDYADGERTLVIRATSNTLWRTSVMTHPFYMEFQSKQSVLIDDPEDDDQWGYLYDVSEEALIPTTFVVDFWGDGNVSPDEHEDGTETKYTTPDFVESGFLTEYPQISQLPITIKLYGWSRAGQGTVNDPNDPDFPNGEGSEDGWNDEFTAEITVLHTDETEETISVDNLTSSYKNPEQTWYLTRSGDYPVIHSGGSSAGFEVGDKIKSVSFVVTSGSTGDHTYYYVERMEIPEVTMYVPLASLETSGDREPTEYRGSLPVFTFDSNINGWERELEDYVHGNGIVWEENPGQYSYQWDNSEGHDANGCLKIRQNGYYISPDTDINGEACMKYEFNPPRRVWEGETITVWAQAWGTYMNEGFIMRVYYTDDTYDETYYHVDYSWDWTQFTITIDADSSGKAVTKILVGHWAFGWDGRYESNWWFDDINVVNSDGIDVSGGYVVPVGVPKIFFSSRPFHAFNFQAYAKLKVTGAGAYGGVVGLASDNKNYIVARTSATSIELVKVRDGVETELASTSTTGNIKGLLFEHRDGILRVWVRNETTTLVWDQTPDLTYEWTEADGQLCLSDDIIHVGLYAFRDAPKLRICSFNASNSSYLGLLPLGDDELDDFPSSGQVVIEGVKYDYTAKVTPPSTIQGPYQARATTKDWDYTADGIDFDGNAVEFTLFEWLDQSTYYNKWNGKIMASSNGHAWLMGRTDQKPWIKTTGEMVYLKNRGRFFGTDVSGNNVGWNQKMWITGGLSGVILSDEEASAYTHPEGSYAYLESESEVILSGFAASNGYEDMTVEDMLGKVCQIAGGEARFPGDVVQDTKTLTSTEWTVA